MEGRGGKGREHEGKGRGVEGRGGKGGKERK